MERSTTPEPHTKCPSLFQIVEWASRTAPEVGPLQINEPALSGLQKMSARY
jgi:hypothetical protein